jgi:hypothetical protein
VIAILNGSFSGAQIMEVTSISFTEMTPMTRDGVKLVVAAFSQYHIASWGCMKVVVV